jgi:AbiTii
VTSIVSQLQADAAGSTVPLIELLGKALVIAAKLGHPEFQRWIRNELDGYGHVERFEDLPPYRQAHGDLRVHINGRDVPVTFDMTGAPDHAIKVLKELISAAEQFPLARPVSEIEQLCAGNGTVKIRKDGLEQLLRETGETVRGPISLHIAKATLRATLQAVRQALLQWTIDLEQQGVDGGVTSFPQSDKEKAHTIHYTINNFGPGAIGQFSHGNDNVQNVHTTSGIPMEDLHKLVTSLEAERAKKSTAQFEHALAELQAATNAPKPEKGKIKNALVVLKDAATLAQIGMNMLPKIYEMIGMLS